MSKQYIGMDVHKAITVICVLDSAGKVRAEAKVETKAATIVQFLRGLEGRLYVTLEESTYSAWLYDVLSPHAAKVVVCDPRKNAAYIKSGNKSDRIDAHKLADLLRTNMLSAVYHGHSGVKTLQELARSYLCLVEDATRVMNRIKAIYRGRGIACGGTRVYAVKHRAEWLPQLSEPGVRRRAELLYQQLDLLLPLRRQAKQSLLAESRQQGVQKLLRTIPGIGPLRAALLIALMQTPHRFRTNRQLWAYAGMAVVTHDSAEYCLRDGRIERSKKRALVRGLNRNYNRTLKQVFQGAAATAGVRCAVLHQFYSQRLAQGMKPELALLTLARKIATIVLELGKKGERFDERHLNAPAA
jgi:transposase